MKQFAIVIAMILLLPCISFAHSGGTDENGGHYDSSTGSYHYHHGYPAHQHTDGICPYDYDDKTGYSSGSSSNSGSSSKSDYTSSYVGEDYFDGFSNGYDDGYDDGYDVGYSESKRNYIPIAIGAFCLPTAIAGILTYRSNENLHKENKTLFQLQQQRKEAESNLLNIRRKNEIEMEKYKQESESKKLKIQQEFDRKKLEFDRENSAMQHQLEVYQKQISAAKEEAEKRMKPYIKGIETQYSYQKEEIEKLKQERKRLEGLNDGLRKSIEENSDCQDSNLSRLIPKGTILNADGYPVEIKPTGYDGDKYYVVINHNSAVYHHPSCQHAWSRNRVHILDAAKTHRPCAVCKRQMPDMTWYRTYISRAEAKKKQ